jgi:hypothetical protein
MAPGDTSSEQKMTMNESAFEKPDELTAVTILTNCDSTQSNKGAVR